MKKQNDNRMAWIRNIEKLQKSDKDSYFIEHEVATECHISGVLDYDNSKILCGLLTANRDKRVCSTPKTGQHAKIENICKKEDFHPLSRLRWQWS